MDMSKYKRSRLYCMNFYMYIITFYHVINNKYLFTLYLLDIPISIVFLLRYFF